MLNPIVSFPDPNNPSEDRLQLVSRGADPARLHCSTGNASDLRVWVWEPGTRLAASRMRAQGNPATAEAEILGCGCSMSYTPQTTASLHPGEPNKKSLTELLEDMHQVPCIEEPS